MSERIEDLIPEMQAKYHLLAGRLADARISFIVVSTLRSYLEQDALYAQGRFSLATVNAKRAAAGLKPIGASENTIVTNCDGIATAAGGHGRSMHQLGKAMDITFCDDNVNPNWPDVNLFYHRWLQFGQIIESCGLVWGGRFQPLDKNGLGFDPDHAEMPS